jgi:hypothetical protein
LGHSVFGKAVSVHELARDTKKHVSLAHLARVELKTMNLRVEIPGALLPKQHWFAALRSPDEF